MLCWKTLGPPILYLYGNGTPPKQWNPQQDNMPCHITKTAQEWLEEHNKRAQAVDQASISPDPSQSRAWPKAFTSKQSPNKTPWLSYDHALTHTNVAPSHKHRNLCTWIPLPFKIKATSEKICFSLPLSPLGLVRVWVKMFKRCSFKKSRTM